MVDYISFGNLNWQKFYLCSGHAKIREATAGSINTHFNKKGGVGRRTVSQEYCVLISRRNFIPLQSNQQLASKRGRRH